jgi:anti-sigma regulatory factor (Ser/Thr protein kinase)
MASPELHFCMAVDAAHLQEARRQVRTFLDDQGIDEDAAFDILLCVHEACANAIEHSDSTIDVEVAVCLDEASVSIVVKDAGRGLEAIHHADHHRPATLSSDGRGLYVMSRLMDGLDVHIDDGTEIRMVKRLALVALSGVA